MKEINKTNEEWKKELPPEVYHVTREKGTEPAFTGKHLDNKGKGMYVCSNCGTMLFSSDTKFDSGTGWPSFTDAVNREHIKLQEDHAYGMSRVEVLCRHCGAHLGHVFDDGPADKGGKRYCINSCSLDFKSEEGK